MFKGENLEMRWIMKGVADDWTRFDEWSPLVPIRGQEVQLQFEKDGEVFDTDVLFRAIDTSRRRYSIWVRWPVELDGELMLDITPDAGPGMQDKANDLRPLWRTVPKNSRETRQAVKLFFKD